MQGRVALEERKMRMFLAAQPPTFSEVEYHSMEFSWAIPTRDARRANMERKRSMLDKVHKVRTERTRRWLANSPDKQPVRGRRRSSVVKGWTKVLEKVSRGEASASVVQLDTQTAFEAVPRDTPAPTPRSLRESMTRTFWPPAKRTLTEEAWY